MDDSMLPGWDPNLVYGDRSGSSEVPIPDFDDFFADLPPGFDAPPPTKESARPRVVAEGSHIINGCPVATRCESFGSSFGPLNSGTAETTASVTTCDEL
ncbi:hypothetical protein Bca52824_075132 [Brassica carinata]|uniref:Uncharacterized protein n=1 Tax=Brassica carinata TaxID=52824 RepID=A0A8X7PRH0_BRACI|nr:hypothetical protein Bca52824_075132 [Brassica carinata]